MANMGRIEAADQGRVPVQWDATPGAGFTTGTPWIGINPDHVAWNAAAQVGVVGSVFEYYRQLIALRHTDAVVTEGDFELLVPEHPTVLGIPAAHTGCWAAGGRQPLRRRGGGRATPR